jgi:hypothetical protein
MGQVLLGELLTLLVGVAAREGAATAECAAALQLRCLLAARPLN